MKNKIGQIMRFRNEKKDTNIMINITSLIDVVFILLIFFAVTTSFVTPSSIKVDLPKAKGEAVEEKKNIRIAVDSKGALFLDGEAVKDDELESKLKVLKDVNPEALVFIEADEKSLHGKVVFVIDKAKSADFTRFAIATEEAKQVVRLLAVLLVVSLIVHLGIIAIPLPDKKLEKKLVNKIKNCNSMYNIKKQIL